MLLTRGRRGRRLHQSVRAPKLPAPFPRRTETTGGARSGPDVAPAPAVRRWREFVADARLRATGDRSRRRFFRDPLRRPAGRRELVEGEEKRLQLCEALGAELLRPGRLDLVDGFADDANRSSPSLGHRDPLAALVARVGPSLEIAELLELAEKVVEGLLAHLQPGRELRGPRVVGPRPLEGDQVGGVEVRKAAFVKALEHPPVDRVDRHRRSAPISSFANTGDDDATALAIVTPGILGADYFREAKAVVEAAAGGPPDLAALGEVMRRHGLTPVS